MPVQWKTPRIAKSPIELSALPSARRVRLVDPRQDLQIFWVTPDSGSCVSRDSSTRTFWDHAIRRELRDRSGWLGMAINPYWHGGKERASGEKRWDLVLEVKDDKFKFARLLCDWENEDGSLFDGDEQAGLEVDHVRGGAPGKSPFDYRLSNLRPLDVPTHRKLQPPRGLKRPAAALSPPLRRPAQA